MFSVFSEYELNNYKHPCIGFCVNMFLFLLDKNKERDCWVVWYVYNFVRNAQIVFQSGLLLCIFASDVWEFHCSTASPTLCCQFFFYFVNFISVCFLNVAVPSIPLFPLHRFPPNPVLSLSLFLFTYILIFIHSFTNICWASAFCQALFRHCPHGSLYSENFQIFSISFSSASPP